MDTARLRLDVGYMLMGALLVAMGLAVLALWFLRRARHDRTLISFGSLGILYGLRLLARSRSFQALFDCPSEVWSYLEAFLTYTVPIAGAIFAEELLGRGWKSTIRRQRQLFVVYGVGAILTDILARRPGAAMALNSYIVVLGVTNLAGNLWIRRREPVTPPGRVVLAGLAILGVFILNANLAERAFMPGTDLEPIGVVIFLSCLGYFVANRLFANEARLLALSHELETARQIQSSILPRRIPSINGLDISARYLPMASVAGDFYDFLTLDERRLGILVADVSGHGVPAALIASMLKVAVAAQSDHAADPSRVLEELNRILCGNLERSFVTAAYVFVDAHERQIVYANAGHPPLLIWRHGEQRVDELRDNGIFLGQFDHARYRNTCVSVAPGDRVLLYTDGIVEATNREGEFFDDDRLKAFMARNSEAGAGRFADDLLEHLKAWAKHQPSAGFDDDVTLVVVDVMG